MRPLDGQSAEVHVLPRRGNFPRAPRFAERARFVDRLASHLAGLLQLQTLELVAGWETAERASAPVSNTKTRAKLRSEPIEIEIDGEVRHGRRTVSGEQELHQVIQFESIRAEDPNGYTPDDYALMRAMAQAMLRDLVEQWKARGLRKPVKVEPRGPHQKREIS